MVRPGKNEVLLACHQHATNKHGKCLETSYVNSRVKMTWKCEEGHIWKCRWSRIKNEHTWCPICSDNKPFISEVEKFIISKKGILHTKEYRNSRQKLHLECEKGHKWEASWNRIYIGNTWCAKCAFNVPDISILQEHANTKGGQLISTIYVSARCLLEWKCSNNHTWEATWDSVSHMRSWCPQCYTFKSEKECISLAMSKLNILLNKKRIYFNPENKKEYLEFDGYNEEHKLAIEYNGIQHYEYVPKFHRTKQGFIYQQERDERKRLYCKKEGITLIEIPYTYTDITAYIKDIHV